MKKISKLMLAAVLVFSTVLAGCGKQAAEQKSDTSPTESKSNTEETSTIRLGVGKIGRAHV